MAPVLMIVILACIGATGDFFIKLSGNGPKFIETKWFVIGALLYVSTAFGWFWVMKHIELSSLGVMYSLTTSLLLVAIGVFYFHEKLNAYEIAAILCALLSLILLSRFGD